jgi:hypothetical protein
MAKAVVPIQAFRKKFGDLNGEAIADRLQEFASQFLHELPKDAKAPKADVKTPDLADVHPVKAR